jgi:hypothetical protein
MLLKKGELHRLISVVEPKSLAVEVGEKLDLLHDIFKAAALQLQTDQV